MGEVGTVKEGSVVACTPIQQDNSNSTNITLIITRRFGIINTQWRTRLG